MILDTLDNLSRYTAMHPAFAQVIDYLNKTDLKSLEKGKHEIDGSRVYVAIDVREGKGREGTRIETHRNYLDIQITLAGNEEIGWKAAAALETPSAEYDDKKDVQFFADAATVWCSVPEGHFAIYWPEDAHAPLAGTGTLQKAIVKVAVK